MNRLYQIERTLGKNLADNRMFGHLVEFILVDFGSKDGLMDWIKQNFMDDIESGLLKYYYTDKMKSWHASIAKNTSHLYANGDVLMNLDCDNYTGYNGGKFVIQQFMNIDDDIILHQVYIYLDGSFGRIGMRREFFHAIGGYNEAFAPMGYEDIDLLERLKALGLRYVHAGDRRYNNAIPNTREESIGNIIHKVEWDEMNRSNRLMSDRNISEGRVAVNVGVEWGIREDIFDIYGNPAIFKT